MLGKINGQLRRAGHPPFSGGKRDIPLIANMIFHSMAQRYAQVLGSIAAITGKNLKRLFMVGAGRKKSLLNRLTAERTGLEVWLASASSPTAGTFAIPMTSLQGTWNETIGA